MDLLAIASGVAHGSFALAQEEPSGLQINLFWVIVSALNFVFFAVLLYWLFGAPLTRMLNERRQRVEQGQLADAPLTLRQLETIKTEFTRVLVGMYHNRIDYPAAAGGVTSEFASA